MTSSPLWAAPLGGGAWGMRRLSHCQPARGGRGKKGFECRSLLDLRRSRRSRPRKTVPSRMRLVFYWEFCLSVGCLVVLIGFGPPQQGLVPVSLLVPASPHEPPGGSGLAMEIDLPCQRPTRCASCPYIAERQVADSRLKMRASRLAGYYVMYPTGSPNPKTRLCRGHQTTRRRKRLTDAR